MTREGTGLARPLAVIAPVLGASSETFIQRQMEDLLPGRTAVVVNHRRPPEGGHWSVSGPMLVLEEATAVKRDIASRAGRAARRLIRRALRQGVEEGRRAAAVRRFLREQGVRVILSQYLCFSLEWLGIARELGIRFYAHAHGFDVTQRLREAEYRERYLEYNQADGVITMSQASGQRLAQLGIKPERIHVVLHGVDVPAAPPSHEKSGGGVRCIAVGRMVGKKAPLLTLEAFRRAASVEPELELEYIGAGPLLEPARQFVESHGLGERVRLHGEKAASFVQARLDEGDLFLQHSIVDPATGDGEGFPVAILEAMAHGLAVVATRHAGIPEQVEEGTTGYLVEEQDVQAMAERIVELARDRKRRLELGRAGWARCRERFSWSRQRGDLLRVMGLTDE